MADWQNGMQAICISREVYDIKFGEHPLTVRTVVVYAPGTLVKPLNQELLILTRDVMFLQFVERPNDIWYAAEWFRPLQKLKRETDISALKKLLVPTTKVKENV